MTFPAIGTPVNTDGSAANSTTITVALPASVAAGDLLIVAVCSDSGASTHSIPAGWTILKNEVFQSVAWAFIAYRIATGGETSVVVTKTTERSNALAWRITGWHGTTPPEVTVATTSASSAGPDSGSLTPSWGAADTLWMSLAFWDDSALPTLTSYPTNYTLGQGNDVSGSSGGRLAGAARQINAASEDPGAFVLTGVEQWNAYTIGIRPGAAVGAALAGTIDAVSATTGALTTSITAAGSVAAVSALTGALTTSIQMAGTTAGVSNLPTATLTTSIRLAGSVTAVSGLTGALTTQITMSGSVAAVSGLTGTLAGAAAALAGTVTGSSALTGALTTSITMGGSVTAVSAVTGALTTAIRLAGTVSAVSSVTGVLTGGSAPVVAAAPVTNDGGRAPLRDPYADWTLADDDEAVLLLALVA